MKREKSMEVTQGEPALAISAGQLADRMGVSLRRVRRIDSAGLIPKPIRLGRSVRWPLVEVHAWLKAGAPERRRWEQIKYNGQDGRRR